MTNNSSVLDWLLDPADPPVRYRALTGLLRLPQDDPQVQETRARLADCPTVRRLFAGMHPDGYWLLRGKGEGVDYAIPSSTHFILAYLAETGLDRADPRVARAVERYLSLKAPDDIRGLARWQIPPDYRNHTSCLYAYNLRTFILLGYRDDPRVFTRVQVLLGDGRADGGYLCDRPSFSEKTKSCIRGSLKALMAFAEMPEQWQSPACQQLVDYFLRRRVFNRLTPPGGIVRPEFTRASFPFFVPGSLLEPLYALSRMGYGGCAELAEAWDCLDQKRGPDGRYVLDWSPKTKFAVGKKGQPNKWITLYALMALEAAGQ